MKYLYFFLFSFNLCLITACKPSSVASTQAPFIELNEEPSEPISQKSEVVATVGDEIINLKALDQTVQLAIFDLEWRKYEIRKSALNKLIAQRQFFSNETLQSEIFLAPPRAPRLDLPQDKRLVKGHANAPVLLSVFCSFQSSHCARLQPTIKKLEAYYGESVRLRYYDLPQSFHRYAKAAANAFHCANEFGKPWVYMDALYADITRLDKARFLIIAEQLGFDLNTFEPCLDERRYDSNIKADLQLAGKMGLGNVPVVFINGLYTKGPQTIEAYRYYVDQELVRLGAILKTAVDQKLMESKLPITLMATTVGNNERNSTALIKLKGSNEGSIYKVGESLSDNIVVLRIEQQRIIIINEGRNEFVNLQASKGDGVKYAGTGHSAKEVSEVSLNQADEADAKQSNEAKQRELPATGEMTLSKDWLANQLIDKASLNAHFNNAEHVVEGQHLIKLNNIDDQRFYNTLGLKTGDVLMRVNDQWVHEGENPLWDSLEKEKTVSVILMRKGHPIRYDYNIE